MSKVLRPVQPAHARHRRHRCEAVETGEQRHEHHDPDQGSPVDPPAHRASALRPRSSSSAASAAGPCVDGARPAPSSRQARSSSTATSRRFSIRPAAWSARSCPRRRPGPGRRRGHPSRRDGGPGEPGDGHQEPRRARRRARPGSKPSGTAPRDRAFRRALTRVASIRTWPSSCTASAACSRTGARPARARSRSFEERVAQLQEQIDGTDLQADAKADEIRLIQDELMGVAGTVEEEPRPDHPRHRAEARGDPTAGRARPAHLDHRPGQGPDQRDRAPDDPDRPGSEQRGLQGAARGRRRRWRNSSNARSRPRIS